MRVRYTPRAQTDLDAIFRYLDIRTPAGAHSVKSAIERHIELLGEFPRIGPETEISGVYELSIVRYPYKVYYEISGEEVWILHIRHTARRPWEDGIAD